MMHERSLVVERCRTFESALPCLLAHSFEKRVAEYAVRCGGSVQVLNTVIEGFTFDQPRLERRIADAREQRGKRSPREAVDQSGPARIDIDHARRDVNAFEFGFDHERIE